MCIDEMSKCIDVHHVVYIIYMQCVADNVKEQRVGLIIRLIKGNKSKWEKVYRGAPIPGWGVDGNEFVDQSHCVQRMRQASHAMFPVKKQDSSDIGQRNSYSLAQTKQKYSRRFSQLQERSSHYADWSFIQL